MSDRKMPKKNRTKSLTVRLPLSLAMALESEARKRKSSVSQVVRNRLEARLPSVDTDPLAPIRDLIAPIPGMPKDVSSRVDYYLKKWGYGKNRHR